MVQINFTISDVIDDFSSDEIKRYLSSYKLDGFELGFGRRGTYSGHSHLYFTDLLFSPGGVSFSGNDKTQKANLVIVPRETLLSDVLIGNFCFLKFCEYPLRVTFPEKMESANLKGTPLSLTGKRVLRFYYYKTDTIFPERIVLLLFERHLRLKISNKLDIIIN
jgi:hypothetical protein